LLLTLRHAEAKRWHLLLWLLHAHHRHVEHVLRVVLPHIAGRIVDILLLDLRRIATPKVALVVCVLL
jgi:hypothetical protein